MNQASVVPSPPNPFPPVNIKNLPKGFILFRIHDTTFAGNQFNPCQGKQSRFAPLYDAADTCVPTLYAATSFDAAAFESVFHDVPYNAKRKFVKHQDIMSRASTKLETMRELHLVQLFEPDLKNWNITRSKLIDTLAATYGETVCWAQAIHSAEPSVDGLIWTSRQCDPDLAMILFEGRVNQTEITVQNTTPVEGSPSLLESIRQSGHRAGIVIVT